MSLIEKFNPSKALTVLYYNELKKASFIKRFIPEFSDKKVCMYPEEDGNKFVKAVTDKRPQIRVEFNNEEAKKPVDPEEIILDEFVEVMGVKAKGKKLSNHPVSAITWLDPIPVEEEENEEEIEDIDESEDVDESEIKKDEDSLVENESDSEENDNTVADEVDWIEDTEETKVPKKPKEVKQPKEPKEPKAVKEPKATKEVKEKKEPKAPIPPVNPPDFPEDDDPGTGIQMSLF
jgi:hypothetical protein